MSALEGRATADGTARFATRSQAAHHAVPEHFRPGPGGLSLSSMGLGTYIGRPDASTDLQVEEAARICLSSGRINVLDTAINYRYQRAERSLGRALQRLVEAGTVRRDEVFVATKAGYFAPDAESATPADQWVERELIAPGLLDPADIVDGCHAMSRSYLADQFRRSQENLGLATIDLLYLHNAADAQLPVVGASEFRRRLAEAFGLCEQLRDQGRLVAYGLATWDCLRVPSNAPGAWSIAETVRIAEEVGGVDHGFRFLQFPFSLAMPEATVARTQRIGDHRATVFEAAAQRHLGCFTSVPLVQGQLARSGRSRDGLTPAQTAIQFARSAPGSLGPLIGQKRPEPLAENLQLAGLAPWSPVQFERVLS